MKVWILHTLDDNRTLGVFKTRRRAEKVLKDVSALYGGDNYYISSSIVE